MKYLITFLILLAAVFWIYFKLMSLFKGREPQKTVKQPKNNIADIIKSYIKNGNCQQNPRLVYSSLIPENGVDEYPKGLKMWTEAGDIYYFSKNPVELNTCAGMFANTPFSEIDLSGFDTKNVNDMTSMFANCSNLENVYFGDNFNTKKVTSMSRMFLNCNKISFLDLNSFNTSQVTTMEEMFAGCKVLESLNLSKFETSKVDNMSKMFYDCEMLKKVIASEKFDVSFVKKSDLMFERCIELSDVNKLTDKTFAKIDTPNSRGYFIKE